MPFQKISDYYSLKKSKRTLSQTHKRYKRKASSLGALEREKLQTHLVSLKTAIDQKEAPTAQRIAQELETITQKLIPKTRFCKVLDFVLSLGSALVLALCIRQSWFEPYMIPSGSMRPTLKENDFLLVSKTDFGINIPLTTSHLHFDPALIQRGSIVVFTGKNMDIDDVDTLYFYVFPGKKMFVKRLIGKPGDTLYFYGGQIYGIDVHGEELKELRDPSWFQQLEHIPFIRYDGKVETPSPPTYLGLFNPTILHQMNIPVAQWTVNPFGKVSGEMLPISGGAPLKGLSDLWGFKHFAMARLLTKEQLKDLHGEIPYLEKQAVLYLELHHHPSIQDPQIIRDEQGRLRPDVSTSVSFLPLETRHLEEIAHHMTTCRFIVKEGKAYRLGYDAKNPYFRSHFPKIENVPDGTYEFQNGKAYKILWGGVTQELPTDHPLYRRTAELIQFFYNLGIEMLDPYVPSKTKAMPSRYAYFRNHDLYLLGHPVLLKDDPVLVRFLQQEYQKQSLSSTLKPYTPFEDQSPPLTIEGKIDTEFMRKYGLKIPEKMYLVLGDNHAMSADSRVFGFVPQENLRGGPSFLFWPPGERWGRLPQATSPHLTFPNLAVWIAAFFAVFSYRWYNNRKFKSEFKVK